jgi:uroporphyrinogen-III synthase
MGVCQARAMSRASKKFPLAGWYVISMRPLGQHGGVRSNAARFGARAFALSTLRLQPIAAMTSLRQALRCPRVVVTSPAAVRAANAQVALRQRPGQHWFALGRGSAAALRRCGISRVLHPERGSDSESLLAHELLNNVRGEKIGLITAPNGRGLLADELQARGADLVVAEVYRREPLPLPPARIRALGALPKSTAVLITSSEAFTLLWQALDAAARRRLVQRPCVVASDRLAAQALAWGFSPVIRAGDASPGSLLSALADHVGDGGFR